MAEAAQNVAPMNRQSVQPGQTIIKGRIENVRKAGTLFLHRLILPAADAYSAPACIEIRASRRLGDSGDDWSGVVQLGGYRRSYRATDRETGEIRQIMTADNTLTAVE